MYIAFKINNHITEYVAVETTIEYSTSIPFTTFFVYKSVLPLEEDVTICRDMTLGPVKIVMWIPDLLDTSPSILEKLKVFH